MLKFGLDPEVFSTVQMSGKDFVVSPALLEKDCGLNYIYQDVEEKHPVYIDRNFYSWMMDGVAWELTVKNPLNSASEVFEILEESTQDLEDFLGDYFWNGEKLNLYKKPVVNINPAWYLPFLDDYKMYQGFIFGCDPDMDAVDLEYNCKTRNIKTHKFRYGGGHIHLSGMDEFKEFPRQAVWFLAMTVGNYCCANSPYPEQEILRAKEYGRPGRFRPQIYKNGDVGIEYRTPSNSWISFPIEQMEELFYYAELGCKFLRDKRDDLVDKYLSETCRAINEQDSDTSQLILNELEA